MKSLAEIEAFIDALPPVRGPVQKRRAWRKKTFTRTLPLIGGFLCLLLVVVLILSGMMQVLVVLSGSMQPTLAAGDVVVIIDTPVEQLVVDDVITYQSPENPGRLMTHRITSIQTEAGGWVCQTKGDANEHPDNYKVSADNVVGRMVVSVPYLGTVAQVSRSVVGYVLLVLIPGVLVVCSEIRNIYKKQKNDVNF